MKHSEASVRASFRQLISDRRGSVYVEASMVMPMTCLIMAAMIAVIMSFYGDVSSQTEDHIEQASRWDITAQIEVIRKNVWHII